MDRRVKAATKRGYIVRIYDISLADHGASRRKIDMKPTKCFLNLSTQKISRSEEQKSNLNHKKVIISQLLTFPRLTPVYRPRTPRRKAQVHYQKYILFTFLPALSQKDLWPFTRVTVPLRVLDIGSELIQFQETQNITVTHRQGAYCCSVAQSCPTLCDPMDCSTPGFFVLHYLQEFT